MHVNTLLKQMAKAFFLALILVVISTSILGSFSKKIKTDYISNNTILERSKNEVFINSETDCAEFKLIAFQKDGYTVEVYQNNQNYKTIFRAVSDSSFEFSTPNGEVVNGEFKDYTKIDELENEMFYNFLLKDIDIDSDVNLVIKENDITETLNMKN